MPPSPDLAAIIDRYMHGSDHPDLQVYRRDMTVVDFDLWEWRIRHFCDLGNFHGKKVLEAGCGFGWDAVGLALIGNNRVIAMDILPSMVDGVSQCLDSMKSAGHPLPVTPLQGDICELDMPDESLDGIFSTEAIEHVHDLPKMFAECFRLLRPGGAAVIVNDSNRYNPDAREHSWGAWKDRDDSWEHVEWLKSEVRPVEHADAKPYGVMREDIIRASAPHLSSEDIAILRKATAGMVRTEIEAAVLAFERDGSLPAPDPYGWCRNPETGEYSERLLDPFELKDLLTNAGFKVQLRHLFRKMPFRLANSIALKAINLRLFAMRPHFVLVAKKPR